LFSILLFYSTVCFHFAEQINDDDDDDEIKAGQKGQCMTLITALKSILLLLHCEP